MDIIDPLTGPRLKIKRAKDHVADLEDAIRVFRKEDPYEIFTEDDPDTGDYLFKVKVNRDPPIEISLIVGDIIHNLRCALDHLAYQLVLGGGGTPTSQIYFPISDSAKEFKSKGLGKIKGASEQAVKIVETLKPYKGGNDDFWKLHKLDILDKHRLLIPVGCAYERFKFDAMNGFPSDIERLNTAQAVEISIPVADRLYPLKDGTVVLSIRAQSRGKMDMNPKFAFTIAFGDGEIVKGEPILPTLVQLMGLVEQSIELFAPIFKNK